jgi:hypothetical protein
MIQKIGVGELLRTWHELSVDANDQETRKAIRDLLLPTFAWTKNGQEHLTPEKKDDKVDDKKVGEGRDEILENPPEFLVPPKDLGLSFTTTPIEPKKQVLAMPTHNGSQLDTERQFGVSPEPLLEPVWAKRVVGSLLSTDAPLGSLDVNRLLRQLVEMRELKCLPRKNRSTLRQGTQVLLDRHPTMMVFYSDQSALRKEIEAFVGTNRTETLRCDTFPPTQVSEIASVKWYPYTLPAPQVPVLVVSDLGKTRNVFPNTAVLDKFLEPIKARGCPVFALVPCAPDAYPLYIRDRMCLLLWDRDTRPSDARRLRRARR